MKILLFLFTAFSLVTAQVEKKNVLEMPSIFSDNMVLQQKSFAPFWGKAEPKLKVVIKTSWGASSKTEVNNEGQWQTKIKTPKYGGPYTINIKIGESSIIYKNVLIGEVWLCSGQSNMEMPLEGWPPRDTIANSKYEIANANYPKIRLFTVARIFSDKPEFNCSGSWVECSPQTVNKFSATAFFFGKKLHKEIKMPIGLIHSSWGGTPVEAWISGKNIGEIKEYKEIINKLSEAKKDIEKLQAWLDKHSIINMTNRVGENRWEGLDFLDADCAATNFDDNKWKDANLPGNWENTEVGNFDGVMWYRKKIEIPQNWISKDLILSLGPIDDMDATFVNGQRVGGFERDGFWQTDRVYTIPKELVKDSLLTIAVRVIDNQGGGGIWGQKEKLNIQLKDSEEKISLAGKWRYLAVAEYRGAKFYVFGSKGEEYFNRPVLPVELSPYTPTVLYNAMIAPLVPYSIKGAIWYQGEANTNNPEAYKTLFPMMIKNWREDFMRGDFPFYYTQIAPYNYGVGTNSQRVREAQMVSLKTLNTGMAVTLDIGNPNNIHPTNKKDVGERLALWALAKDYGKKIVYSGPIYKSMKIIEGKITISFDHADGGLMVKERESGNNFLIAGEDKKFVKANVNITGKDLVVFNPLVPNPVAVRYCWDDTSEATVFNKAGLPASSFRTDDWQE